MYHPGETIVLEGMIGSRTGLAIPATIVDDIHGNLGCFVPDGVSLLRLGPSSNAPLPRVLSPHQIDALDLRLVPQTWTGKNILYIAPPRSRYAIHVRWSADWTFLGWYVNLQSRTVFLGDRWITEDQFLDIVVLPDRAWRWKDNDELGEAVSIGRLSTEEANEIQTVGESLIPRIERGAWPFSPDSSSWRPDPKWPRPAIPPGWEPTHR